MGKRNISHPFNHWFTKVKDVFRQPNTDLCEKTNQCRCFVWIICVFGITVPLVTAISFLEKTTPQLTIFGILTAVIPTVFAFSALIRYHRVQTNNTVNEETKKRKERIGDWLLYSGGFFSIILISIYISLSGGIMDNLMAFYYVFIPSATAVAFRTRMGLLIVSIMSFICMLLLYLWEFEPEEFAKPEEYMFLIFSLYQIILVILLEFFTDKRTNKLTE